MKKRGRRRSDPWQKVRDLIRGADVIVEIVDARDIEGTRVPLAEKWAGVSRLLMIANKKDLLPEGKEIPGIVISAKERRPEDRKLIIKEIMGRSGNRPVKALLIGYPNVGKSTIINMLARRRAAKVSPVPGTTRNIQWVKVDGDLLVSDYRGVFPRHESEEEMFRKGALNVTGKREMYAYRFAEKALKSSILKGWLEKTYDIDLEGASDSEEVLLRIAKRRGWYLKGGEADLARAARHVLKKMAEAPEIK